MEIDRQRDNRMTSGAGDKERERERENKRLRASTTFRSISSLCHRCITITHLSYRFPISETSATALCGTMLLRVFGWSSNKKIQKGKCSVQPGGLPTSVTFCYLSVCGCHCVPSYPLSLFPPNSLSFARSTCTLHKRTKNNTWKILTTLSLRELEESKMHQREFVILPEVGSTWHSLKMAQPSGCWCQGFRAWRVLHDNTLMCHKLETIWEHIVT